MDIKESFVLCERRGNRVCMSVEAGRNDTEVICSFKDGQIGIYDIERHRCVNQWQLSCSDCLTSAAIFHRSTDQYYAVKNTNELLVWSHDAETFNSFSVRQLRHPVHSVLTTPTSCVTVYTNATVETIRDPGTCGSKRKPRGKQKPATGQYRSILKALYYELGTKEYLLLLSTIDDKYYITIYVCTDCEYIEHDTIDLQLKEEVIDFGLFGNVLLLSCSCGIIFKIDPSLVISTSTLSLHKLIQLSSSALIATSIVGKDYLATVQRTSPPTNISLPPTNVHLPSSNVPLPSTNVPTLETIPKGHWTLSIYDIKYGTLSANATVSSTEELASNMKLSYHQGHVLLNNINNILVYPVSFKGQSSLATALGRRRGFKSDGFISSVQWLEDNSSSIDVSEYVAKLDTDQVPCDAVSTCRQVLQNPANLSQPAIIAHVGRMTECLLEYGKRWCHDELKILIVNKVFPFRQMARLIDEALSKSDWKLLVIILKYCSNVPDHSIVQLLNESLQLPEDFSIKHESAIVTKTDMISSTLQLPRDNSLIQQSLLILTQESVLLLIEVLTKMVNYTNLLSIHSSTLSYSDLIDWIGLVLDAHFIKLVHNPQARPLLMELRDKALSQAVFLSRLSVIVNGLGRPGSLEQPNKMHRNNWLYKVERLELDI